MHLVVDQLHACKRTFQASYQSALTAATHVLPLATGFETPDDFLRKHIGLSGTDFAQRMGVARETVSRWETGATPMGAVADRLLRLLVVTHAPTESYAVDDFLQVLNDMPAPDKLLSVALQIRKEDGWTRKLKAGLHLAKT